MTKSTFFRALAATSLCAGALCASPAHAAPRQYVVVVAEGLSPQILDLGKGYLRKADDDAEESTAFDGLIANGKSADVGPDAISQLQGLLETARANGYKTGLITTSDITAVAPMFYNLTGPANTVLTGADAKYDFLAGGGRAKLSGDTEAKIKDAGGSYIASEEDLEKEITGRVLAPQATGDLDYAIDRDPTSQAGLGELTTLALDILGVNKSPFVLVVHDTLIKKAIDTKDSPALVEQFRELNTILTDISTHRDDNPGLAAAVLMTGGPVTPRFTTDSPEERQNSFFILSNLMQSYAGAGKSLKGADADAITAFADPTDGQYRGWKVPDDVRAGIVAGTLDPEAAIRASYEPAVKLDYAAQPSPPVAYTLGFDAPGGLVSALKSAVSAAPAP